MNPNQTPPADRVRDQEVYARCLVADQYDEGRLYVGDVFRVGHAPDGSKLIQVPYPAVRMEFLRSRGLAERVSGPHEGKDDPHRSVEETLKDARARRKSRAGRQEDSDGRSLPDADGGSD